jgi:hypothetical protein
MAFNPQDAKSILQSTTFWGSIVSLAAMLAPHLYANIAGSASQTAVVSTIVGIVGFVVTVYGRFTATQVVTLTGAPAAPSKGQGKG